MSTETMSVETKATPQITRAAERYLEQYGDPLVMNTYLKVTILVLAVVCVSLAGLAYKSQTALANMHPMIVRINDVGHAEAIDYRNFQYRPQEAENKYYLTRWAELYFNRNRFTIERDQTQSLYFLNSDVQRRRHRPGTQGQQHSELRQRQYFALCRCRNQETSSSTTFASLRIRRGSSSRRFTPNPADHTELKRERWTASVTLCLSREREEQ